MTVENVDCEQQEKFKLSMQLKNEMIVEWACCMRNGITTSRSSYHNKLILIVYFLNYLSFSIKRLPSKYILNSIMDTEYTKLR